jgi:hypothetical protein
LNYREPRRIRDRDHVRFVAEQTCLICGRQPVTFITLRFAQNRAICRGHHREVHGHGDEAAWWQELGLDPTGAARALWLETHPLCADQLRPASHIVSC